MKIHRLSAVFGRLQGETLALTDGLNILQAPNESGKSTWCALLTPAPEKTIVDEFEAVRGK